MPPKKSKASSSTNKKTTTPRSSAEWQPLCPSSQLHLHATLGSGQTFRWRPLDADSLRDLGTSSAGVWRGIVGGFCYELKEEGQMIMVRNGAAAAASKKKNDDEDSFSLAPLQHSLGLDGETFDVALWKKPLTKKDEKLSPVARGLRLLMKNVLNNDPNRLLSRVRLVLTDDIEMIFSFLCSQNNHLTRITSMIGHLATLGTPVAAAPSGKQQADFMSFPTATEIANGTTEAALRDKSFGYRAKYIVNTAAKIVKEGEAKFTRRLRAANVVDARRMLMELSGVGRKVADCILSYTGHSRVAPMDTHLIQMVQQATALGEGRRAVVESSSSDDDDDDAAAKKKKKKKVKKPVFKPADHDNAQAAFVEAFGDHAAFAQLIFFVSRVNNSFFVTPPRPAAKKESGARRQRE